MPGSSYPRTAWAEPKVSEAVLQLCHSVYVRCSALMEQKWEDGVEHGARLTPETFFRFLGTPCPIPFSIESTAT